MQGFAHLHIAVLVGVQAPRQFPQAPVTLLIAGGLLRHKHALAAHVADKQPQGHGPQQAQDNYRRLKDQSDVLQIRPFFLGHHFVQLNQNQQFAILVAHALDKLGRFVIAHVRRRFDL